MSGNVVDLRRGAVVCLADATGSVWLGRLWVGDLAWREGAAFWNLGLASGAAAFADGKRGCSYGRAGRMWNVKDVEGSTGCGLGGGGLGGVMGDVVPIHDVLY